MIQRLRFWWLCYRIKSLREQAGREIGYGNYAIRMGMEKHAAADALERQSTAMAISIDAKALGAL